MWKSIVIQVVLGLVIVFFVYRMSLWLMKKDELVTNERRHLNTKETVRIVDGYAYTSIATNRSWNTVNPDARNYVRLRRSYNRKGGAQFSYQFWMYLDDTTPENVAGKDILMRGDRTNFKYQTSTELDDGVLANTVTRNAEGIVIKCPRIRFGPTHDSIVIELNTLHNPDEMITIDPIAASGGEDTSLRHNILKLMQHKWVLFTFTFEDSVAINDFEDGILVRFYVNDILYNTSSVRSTLRPNNGAFYLMPASGDSTIKNGRIGDVTYYNYAVSGAMIRENFERGPPKYPCKEIMGGDSLGEPLYLSEYNKLDIYNT
jgi:hypothetical protein